MSNATLANSVTASTTTWDIAPGGFFSRHFLLSQRGEVVTKLQMQFWREGCSFSIAGYECVIQRPSLWKDAFELLTGGEVLCDVRRSFWSRRFEITAADQEWTLQPAGFWGRTYQLASGGSEVGSIRPRGWFSRSRVADFAVEVPPPIQVLAIFLVLVVSQRRQNHASHGVGN